MTTTSTPPDQASTRSRRLAATVEHFEAASLHLVHAFIECDVHTLSAILSMDPPVPDPHATCNNTSRLAADLAAVNAAAAVNGAHNTDRRVIAAIAQFDAATQLLLEVFQDTNDSHGPGPIRAFLSAGGPAENRSRATFLALQIAHAITQGKPPLMRCT